MNKPQEWREEFDRLMWECGYFGTSEERAEQGRKDIVKFVADQIALAEKRGAETERGICRQIFTDEVDWAEWGMDDKEAGERFDESRNLPDESKQV